MSNYVSIWNDVMSVTDVYNEFAFSDNPIDPELVKLYRKTSQRDFIVVCENMRKARYLLDQLAETFRPCISKVDTQRCTLQFGYNKWTFIAKDKADITMKGRWRTEVVWEHEFETGLQYYKSKKASKETQL